MTWQDPHQLGRRADTARRLVLLIFAVLVAAFFRVQVIGAERYQLLSEHNRLRPIRLPAPRGVITDRHGEVLAENVPGYSVVLLVQSAESLTATLERLEPVLRLGADRRRDVVQRYRERPTEPVVVLRDASFPLVSALEERRAWSPGLVIQAEPKRVYPHGAVLAHAIGYVGEITTAELEANAVPTAELGALVGRAGLEQQYDALLRGRDGVKFVEVDALGRTVRDARDERVLMPRPGDTLRTSLDLELQRFIAEQFPRGRRGAVLAMEPRTGEVLALYSAPSFDPNGFVGGVDPAAWQALVEAEDHPLFNRAIQARYPPASPWKLVLAAIALRRGIVTMESRMTIPCSGGLLYYTRYFRCWRVAGHGDLNLREAIRHSCDVYFYQLGLKLSLNTLLHDGVELGFLDRSGIDLPSESRPIFPPSAEYYNRRYGPRGWTNAVTLNLAIGQGENAQTLANMVRFYGMLGHPQGLAPEPRLGPAPPEAPARSLGLSSRSLAGLRQALLEVVDRGTAAGARIAELQIAGKTGTAQNPHGADHGWFIAFAPVEDPRIVVGAIVEFAEHGSSIAPYVNRVIARYLLGPDSLPAADFRLVTPADSAPEPVPILPDTARRF